LKKESLPLAKLKRLPLMSNRLLASQRNRAISPALARAGITQKQLLTAGHYVRATILDNTASMEFLADAGIPLRHQKASSTLIDSAGGFLVAPEIESSIISLRDVFGIARQYATVLQMGSDERSWPRRVAGVTASFVQPENTAITESQLSFDEIHLIAKKVAASIRISNELFEDETVALGAWFILEISAAFARKEDDCTFVGDGSSAYGGIRGICNLLIDSNHTAGKAAAAATHSSLDKIDAPDLAALMGLLPSYAWPNARWYCSGAGVGLCLARLAAIGGGSIGVAPDGLAYMGFPISIIPSMPAAGSQVGKVVIAFGDLSLAVALGSRTGVSIRNSSDRYLDNDQTIVRGTERFDVVVANIGDSVNPGAVVGLTATA
jgi:HK97 family phage major capsid protein